MAEQWIMSMWEDKERTWGWLVLGGPNNKRVKFMIQLTQFSSTMGDVRPYYEFQVHGVEVE